jgi:hypothetical protein
MSNYNPMTPQEDTSSKFQWCIHTTNRSSSIFKSLIQDNWSLAGHLPVAVGPPTSLSSKYLFYWRKHVKNIWDTPVKVKTSKTSFPSFKLSKNSWNFKPAGNLNNSPTSNCSTPALEVEENIVVNEDDDENDEKQSLDVLQPLSPLCNINFNPSSHTNITQSPNINIPIPRIDNNLTHPPTEYFTSSSTSFFDAQLLQSQDAETPTLLQTNWR